MEEGGGEGRSPPAPARPASSQQIFLPRQCKVGAGVRAAGVDSLRDRALGEGQRRSEETLH